MGVKKYAIGIDFGTLSGRSVLVDLSGGAVLSQSACPYAHGVMEEKLPGGRLGGNGWAL